MPEFPKVKGWDSESLQRYVEWFLDAASKLEVQASEVFSHGLMDSSNTAFIIRRIDNLTNLIEKVLMPPCKKLWVSDRDSRTAPSSVTNAINNQIFPWITRLSGISPDLLPTAYLEYQDSEFQEAMLQLERTAMLALSLFRGDAPAGLAEVIHERIIDGSESNDTFLMLGRVLGSGDGDRRVFTDLLIDELKRNQDQNGGSIKLALWALATSLWRHPGMLFSLQNANHIPFLVDMIDDVCIWLHNSLRKPKGSVIDKYKLKNLEKHFRSICEILMSFLRLRGTPYGASFEAGNNRMTLLAQHIRRIDGLLLRSGIKCESCFKFEMPGSTNRLHMSELAYVLAAYLMGEKGAMHIRIVMLNED